MGKHGLNETGEELMLLNQLSVMNTWFQKKNIHCGIWMHPALKLFLTIDLVMKQRVC